MLANTTGRLLWNGLLDFIYPPHCLICNAHGHPAICPDCYAGFMPLPDPTCDSCGRPLSTQGDDSDAPPRVLPCRFCALAETVGGWGFDRAYVAGAYYGPLRHAIHQLKFNRREFLGEPLGQHLANRAIADGLIAPEDLSQIGLVAPVPLHPARERARGFNQARLLARPVAEMHGVSLLRPSALRRVRKTAPQVGLSGKERMVNLKTDLFVAAPFEVGGKGVLLIDDVMTTGATLSVCARALRDAGASPVFVLALASGA